MGTTEVQAAAEGLELTELEKLEVTRIDGVASPANGFPVLLMKGMPASAPEAAAGCGCCADCTCPPDAAKAVDLSPEAIGKAVEDALANRAEAKAAKALAAEEAVYKRTFTAEQRRKAAGAGHALSDGSYPIESTEDLGPAATLARSKHGKWKAAMKLIARRAKELGAKNPLAGGDEDGKGKTPAAAAAKSVAEGGTTVDTGAQGTDGLSKAVEDAVTKATGPLAQRIAELETANKAQAQELAKVKATPLPGGPAMSAVHPGNGTSVAKARLLAAAEEAEELARNVSDPSDAEAFRQLAASKRAEAAKA